MRLQMSALPTNAVGILRYCMRTFSAAISVARSGCGPDTLCRPWEDMRRSYTQPRVGWRAVSNPRQAAWMYIQDGFDPRGTTAATRASLQINGVGPRSTWRNA